MHAIAVEEFQFFDGGGSPGFNEAAALKGDPQFTLRAENLDRERVEEFVGEDDEWNLRG